MKQIYTYSHLGGEEILMIRYPRLNQEINEVIENIPNMGRGKVSQEKTMKGKSLFSPADMNEAFEEMFEPLGWEELRRTYTISIPNYRHEISNSYKQCDSTKGTY